MKINTYITNKLITLKTSTINLIRKTGTLLGLKKDVFEKSTKNVEKSVLHEGDNYTHIPNSITQQDDLSSITVSKIKFYKKDLEKMKKMNDEECLKYKKFLIEQNRYKL